MAKKLNDITGDIVDCCYQIHKAMGAGLYEKVYEDCLAYELDKKGLLFKRQHSVTVEYEELVIRNAFKFADAQVFIELSEEENASGDRNYLAIHIHDDGPGVDDKHIAHLFDPFYVGNEARNKGKSGHGLGLSIVQKVCEQHDGYVTVRRSKLLGGAQFTLHFPKCNSEPDKPIQ